MIPILIIISSICFIMNVFSFIDKEDNYDTITQIIYSLTLAGLIVSLLILGVEINNNFHTKQPITPKIKIECIDNKCDTTYIYNFKENE